MFYRILEQKINLNDVIYDGGKSNYSGSYSMDSSVPKGSCSCSYSKIIEKNTFIAKMIELIKS